MAGGMVRGILLPTTTPTTGTMDRALSSPLHNTPKHNLQFVNMKFKGIVVVSGIEVVASMAQKRPGEGPPNNHKT